MNSDTGIAGEGRVWGIKTVCTWICGRVCSWANKGGIKWKRRRRDFQVSSLLAWALQQHCDDDRVQLLLASFPLEGHRGVARSMGRWCNPRVWGDTAWFTSGSVVIIPLRAFSPWPFLSWCYSVIFASFFPSCEYDIMTVLTFFGCHIGFFLRMYHFSSY